MQGQNKSKLRNAFMYFSIYFYFWTYKATALQRDGVKRNRAEHGGCERVGGTV